MVTRSRPPCSTPFCASERSKENGIRKDYGGDSPRDLAGIHSSTAVLTTADHANDLDDVAVIELLIRILGPFDDGAVVLDRDRARAPTTPLESAAHPARLVQLPSPA